MQKTNQTMNCKHLFLKRFVHVQNCSCAKIGCIILVLYFLFLWSLEAPCLFHFVCFLFIFLFCLNFVCCSFCLVLYCAFSIFFPLFFLVFFLFHLCILRFFVPWPLSVLSFGCPFVFLLSLSFCLCLVFFLCLSLRLLLTAFVYSFVPAFVCPLFFVSCVFFVFVCPFPFSFVFYFSSSFFFLVWVLRIHV